MSEVRLRCASEEAQLRLGERLARAWKGGALAIHLHGELGTGKTTLVRGVLRGLGYRGKVRSPTYTLVEPYRPAGRPVHHLDLYRLADPEELEYLGIRDLLAEPGLLLVEWPEKGRGWLPEPDLEIFLHHEKGGRRLDFVSRSAAGERLLQALLEKKLEE